MDKLAIDQENKTLKGSWDCYPSEHLATYLEADEQDQRINAHSILTRSLLIDTLWPGKFEALINEEMRFGMIMTWLLKQLKSGTNRFDLIDQITRTAQGKKDTNIPDAVQETAQWLQSDTCPIIDYITEGLISQNPDNHQTVLSAFALNTFFALWQVQLEDLTAERISVIEAACGSANDYQGIHNTGLNKFISYSGFDLASKNISNAKAKFPGVKFFESSILSSGLPDNSEDYFFVHDLIGHLSRDGIDRAVSEMLRIARKEVWINCFNATDRDEHEIRPYESYYINQISIPQLTAFMEEQGASVDVIHISDMLKNKFNYVQDYISKSVTFVATIQS